VGVFFEEIFDTGYRLRLKVNGHVCVDNTRALGLCREPNIEYSGNLRQVSLCRFLTLVFFSLSGKPFVRFIL